MYIPLDIIKYISELSNVEVFKKLRLLNNKMYRYLSNKDYYIDVNKLNYYLYFENPISLSKFTKIEILNRFKPYILDYENYMQYSQNFNFIEYTRDEKVGILSGLINNLYEKYELKDFIDVYNIYKYELTDVLETISNKSKCFNTKIFEFVFTKIVDEFGIEKILQMDYYNESEIYFPYSYIFKFNDLIKDYIINEKNIKYFNKLLTYKKEIDANIKREKTIKETVSNFENMIEKHKNNEKYNNAIQDMKDEIEIYKNTEELVDEYNIYKKLVKNYCKLDKYGNYNRNYPYYENITYFTSIIEFYEIIKDLKLYPYELYKTKHASIKFDKKFNKNKDFYLKIINSYEILYIAENIKEYMCADFGKHELQIILIKYSELDKYIKDKKFEELDNIFNILIYYVENF